MAPAKFSTTKLYVGEAKKDNKHVHVLAYQNSAQSLKDEPNAMILPFPTSAPMDERNVINTTSFKNFLEDIGNASKQVTKGMRSLCAAASADALVFDVGSYTVVLAENVKQIPKALERVAKDKRPELSYRMLLNFGKLYPNQPVAVCCWKGYVEAEPLLWWYEPKDKDVLFVPTMDSHDGNSPDLNAEVETDHIVSTGSTLHEVDTRRNQVLYSDKIPADVRSLLPSHAYGTRLPRTMLNGDMFIKTSEVKNSVSNSKDSFLTMNQYPTIVRGISSDAIKENLQLNGWVG
jgi:hypothetical protein